MTDGHEPIVTDEVLEDCLQALQRSADEGRPATADDIGTFARIPAASAEAALRELRARGLLDTGSDGLRLSEAGRRQAVGILRRHRLSERLLTDVLGLPWDRVHDEAMRLEHSITPDAEARLESLLNNPDTCPHGGPIPPNDTTSYRTEAQPLDTVPAGTQVRIERVTEEESAFLRYLASLGLLPQAELTVEEVAPFGGPLLVRVGGARYAIGQEIATKILIRTDPNNPQRRRQRRRWRGR